MRAIKEIATDIVKVWENPGVALLHINQMLTLTDFESKYYGYDAGDIVTRFLAVAKGFRGANAKALKAELRAILIKGTWSGTEIVWVMQDVML